jgi:hypothetical protein
MITWLAACVLSVLCNCPFWGAVEKSWIWPFSAAVLFASVHSCGFWIRTCTCVLLVAWPRSRGCLASMDCFLVIF